MKLFVWPTGRDIFAALPRQAQTAKVRARAAICEQVSVALPRTAPKIGMTNVLRLGHFLGQCTVETDWWATFEEYASGAAYEGRLDLGNTQKGDGRRFKGRSAIQLTGRDNYRRATPWVAQALGRPSLDLVATPEIVASDFDVGLMCSLWYWETNKLNAWADKDDPAAVSRGVNRGNPRARRPANHETERIAATRSMIDMLVRINTST